MIRQEGEASVNHPYSSSGRIADDSILDRMALWSHSIIELPDHRCEGAIARIGIRKHYCRQQTISSVLGGLIYVVIDRRCCVVFFRLRPTSKSKYFKLEVAGTL